MDKRKVIKKKLVLKKSIRSFISRVLVTIAIFLFGMILVKSDVSFKNKILDNVYNKQFKFVQLGEIYQKYFGNILSIDKVLVDEKPVFQEKLSYLKSSKYKDGVKLTVDENYMVPILESGIVIFLGEKKGYGNTVVVEQVDGIDVYYSNVSVSNIKLYDYVEKGSLIGEVIDTNLYLAFQKEGNFVDYKEYIK